MKIISKFLFLLLLIFTVSGCGSFFGPEQGLQIEDITTETIDEKLFLVISYIDVEEKQYFELKKGEDGLKGNGVQGVIPHPGEEETILEVVYTDTSKPSEYVPIPHGTEIDEIIVVDKDGNKIVTDKDGNEYRVDEEGNLIDGEGVFFTGTKYIKVIYTEPVEPGSDIMKSETFALPEGQKGQDGNGIKEVLTGKMNEDGSIEEGVVNEDGSLSVHFYFTTSDEVKTIQIPANKSIVNVVDDETAGSYSIIITYNTFKEDGTPETDTFTWTKPHITQWLYGEYDPYRNLGNIGDYYYNTTEKSLWFKKELADDASGFGYWDLIINFSVNDKPCYITFDAGTNGGKIVEGENGEIEKDSITQSLISGQYFYGSGKAFPTVYHPEGLKFLGWYTTETITPTSTKFTDLTIVTTDITLYAVWEIK